MAHAGGRPSKYNKEFHPLLAKAFAWQGLTEEEIAEQIGISKATITNWKKTYPEFLASLKEGKAEPDDRVEQALYKRAIGYEHEEDKIFPNNGTPIIIPTIKHYPPDTAAAFIWLKNRRPEKWRDKQEVEHSGNIEYRVIKPDLSNDG